MVTYFSDFYSYISARNSIRIIFHGKNGSALQFENARIKNLSLKTLNCIISSIDALIKEDLSLTKEFAIILRDINREKDFRIILKKLINK